MARDHKSDLRKLTKELFPHYPEPAQVTEFFEAVGVALAAWQLVEDSLYLLFERAIVPQRPGAAGCGFHALQFKGKLLVTDAAVRFALLSAPKDDIPILTEKWTQLFDKARKCAKRRNDFAHFATFSYFDEKDKGKRLRLRPASFDSRFAAGLIERREYTLNDIRTNAESFRKFSVELTAFLAKIPKPRMRQ
jgi:hypothetical protein